MVNTAPKPGSSPAPDPLLGPQPLPEPQSNAAGPNPVPIGSIGGLLGVVSFTQDIISSLVTAFTPEPPHYENFNDHIKHYFIDWERKYLGKPSGALKKEGKSPCQVGVQVGLDGTGLKVAIPASFCFSMSKQQRKAKNQIKLPTVLGMR